jgi:hypothetical protein
MLILGSGRIGFNGEGDKSRKMPSRRPQIFSESDDFLPISGFLWQAGERT